MGVMKVICLVLFVACAFAQDDVVTDAPVPTDDPTAAPTPAPTPEPLVCNAGMYPVGDVCEFCAEGTFSVGGQDACTACPEGQTSESGAKAASECFVAKTCAWGHEHLCDRQTGCTYGCDKDLCWSQCDGACPRLDLNGCHGCKEWCWLSGNGEKYEHCRYNSDCDEVKRNSCEGLCAMWVP